MHEPQVDEHQVVIAGGGPAGMMLGLLLARAGIDVLVLEKHADFLRDFRGDTVHPSTLQILRELGLLEAFLARPHQKVFGIAGTFGGVPVKLADFRHLPAGINFVAFVPQWHFLDFLAGQGRRYPTFHLDMQAEVKDLIFAPDRDDAVVGVRVATPSGTKAIRARLVVGADGRKSHVRAAAHLEVEDFGAPIDVLWMRISRAASDPRQPMGNFDGGRIFVMLDRDDYWQCGYIIAKGTLPALQAEGLAALRQRIRSMAPFLGDRVEELRTWDDLSLLTVKVDRLTRWCRPGLLCIGDAAHAMSPVGGVGINLAIQDAVAAANILAGPLSAGTPTLGDLERVQDRRDLPTRVIQKLQLAVHERVFGRTISGHGWQAPPWPIRLFQYLPFLRRLPARMIGIGFRPEHVRTKEAPVGAPIASSKGH